MFLNTTSLVIKEGKHENHEGVICQSLYTQLYMQLYIIMTGWYTQILPVNRALNGRPFRFEGKKLSMHINYMLSMSVDISGCCKHIKHLQIC